MLDKRLRAKLIEAGYENDDIDLTEREELLALYAEFLVQTQTRISVSEPPVPAMGDNLPPGDRVSGNPDLDWEMFEFEKMKWADEMRKWEAEERRKDAEQKERDRKWEAEWEDRRAELEERRTAREVEMKLKD